MCYAEVIINGLYDITVTQRTEFSKIHWIYNKEYELSTKFGEIKEKIESFFSNDTIQEDLFSYFTSLKSITIPEGVTTIKENAFNGCVGLSQINLPKTLKTLEAHALNSISAEEIILPKGVEYIGPNAFSRSKIQKINIPNIGIINNATFFGCSNLQEISLSEGITSIETLSFFNCKNLKHIKLPSSLKRIGEFAFAECDALEEIEIPENISNIGACAFQNCKNLKKIKFKDFIYIDKNEFNEKLKDYGITNINSQRVWI